MIFVDSDAFIALNHPLDIHNKKAIDIYNSLVNSDEELITSWDVLSEVSTKLSFFLTKAIALSFINYIQTSKIKVEYVTPINSDKIFEFFKKQSSKRVSITDCVNMTICNKLGIKQIFSFDQHYSKNGFKLLK